MTPLTLSLRLVAPYARSIALACVLGVGACLLGTAVPLLVEELITTAAQRRGCSIVMAPAVALVAVIAAQAAMTAANGWLLSRTSLSVTRDLRQQLYQRLQRMPIAWFDRTPTGTIMSRLMDDVAVFQGLASGQTLAALLDIATAAGAAAWIVSRGWRMALLLALIVACYVIVLRIFLPRIRTQTLEVREQLDRVFSRLKQRIDSIQVVRAHHSEPAEISEFTEQFTALHLPRIRANRSRIAFSSLCMGLAGIGAALVFALGTLEVASGHMTVGELIALAALAGIMFGPINRLSELAAVYQQASTSYTRLRELLDTPELASLDADSNPADDVNVTGRIVFDNVSFHYSADRPLLQDIELQIEPQTRVAIVGPTGAGKSTLMNLLLRFYEPTSGEIRFDGQLLVNMPAASLRRRISVVPQEPVVFRGTLAENIRYGTPASDADVESAARAALLDELIRKLPQGLATLVGEGGHPLSQGERQRISIARMICRNPSVVILDEPTSSLDADSETAVQAALNKLMSGRTSFVIAHRLSTIQDADLILVVDHGHIVQQGTHWELLGEDGLYRRLYGCDAAGRSLSINPAPVQNPLSEIHPTLEDTLLTPLSA